jgi:hypothetical protein
VRLDVDGSVFLSSFYPSYRSWRLLGLREVKAPTLLRQKAAKLSALRPGSTLPPGFFFFLRFLGGRCHDGPTDPVSLRSAVRHRLRSEVSHGCWCYFVIRLESVCRRPLCGSWESTDCHSCCACFKLYSNQFIHRYLLDSYGLDGVGFRVPIRSRIFCSPSRPDRLCGPPNL